MRFMIMVPSSPQAEAGELPCREQLARMNRFNQALQKAGVLLERAGLSPTSRGARIEFGEGKPKVTDGPFTEARELIAGFWLIETRTRDEAIEWASRAPFDAGVTLQLRELAELSDWPDEPGAARG